VTVEYSDREQALREEVQENERVLDGLEQNLRAVDAEFAQLADKHHQYDVLARVCRSLEELDGLGVADLFWANSDDNARSTRLGHAQREIDAYEQEIARVEGRRNALVNEINEQNSTLDYLHYDLRDVIAEAESRRNEWELERDADELPDRVQIMPWTRSCEEDSADDIARGIGRSYHDAQHDRLAARGNDAGDRIAGAGCQAGASRAHAASASNASTGNTGRGNTRTGTGAC
jgi:DNA repair exonuclease SbcCD ATPase subunit